MKADILIVEDEAILLMMYSRLLTEHGFNVVGTAFTGETAVQQALMLRPDLILMDIYLNGGIDGIEAAAEIRKTMDVPVIYITGNSETATRERALKTAPSGYLEKPVVDEVLIELVEKVLNSRQDE